MPAKKSQKALADEAWQRVQQTDLIPGQLDISGEIVGESHDTPLPEVSELPEACPACGKTRLGILLWSHMLGGEKVQCVNCGYTIKVPRKAWEAVQSAARITFGGRPKPVSKAKPKRSRGAE